MNRVLLLTLLLTCMIFSKVICEVPYIPDFGYSRGYFPDCPGVNKTAIITKKSLYHLALVVVGRGPPLMARKKRYNYYQMAELAKDPDINFKRRTMVYMVGYLESTSFPLPWLMASAYKDLGYNVMMLDTNRFTTVYYPVACRFMRAVGVHAAEALVELVHHGFNPKTFEFAGISLGAHTISFVAKNYRRLSGYNVSRLTGLDPSGPCFRNMDAENRLDKSDGDFVETIHTNIDGYGMPYPMGHVSYYVNGGEYQVGDVPYYPCMDLCSHIRSFVLWHTALRHPKKFVAIKCDSVDQARNFQCYDRKPMELNYMGLDANKSNPGIYFLSTTYSFPYYIEMNGTKKEYDIWMNRPAIFNEKDVVVI